MGLNNVLFFQKFQSRINLEQIDLALKEAEKKFNLPIYKKYHETLARTEGLNQFKIDHGDQPTFKLNGRESLDSTVESLAKELIPWRKGHLSNK